MALSVGGHAAAKALPSASFGNMAAYTFDALSRFWILSHIGMKVPTNSGMPKKNMVQNFGDAPTALPVWPIEFDALTPVHHASHGQTVETHGIPACSQTAETGMVVSGAEEVTTMSTPVDWMSWVVTWLATEGLD